MHALAIEKGLITSDWERVSKTHYGYYINAKPTPLNKMIVYGYVLPGSVIKAILELRKSNPFLFNLAVESVVMYSKFRSLIIRVNRVIVILRKEGSKRIVNRAVIRLRKWRGYDILKEG